MGTTNRVSPANLHIYPDGHDGTQKPGRGSSQNPSQRLIPLGAGETQNSDRISNKNHVISTPKNQEQPSSQRDRKFIVRDGTNASLVGGRDPIRIRGRIRPLAKRVAHG